MVVRIRPFSVKEIAQLAPQEKSQPFLGDGGFSGASPSRMGFASGSNAPLLRTKFLRPIITPVDDKVLIFDPPDLNPLTRLYNTAGHNTFGHGNKKAKDVRYAFDRVFDDKCGQEMVFENTTKPLLEGLLNGYNASVFAYGATGCGKTHTISGTPDDPGVIFLTMKELYERIETSREECDVQVRLSYLEIYNESIRDLLSPLPTPPGQGLMLREDATRKMSVVGITEHVPESPESVLEMIQEGNLRRTMSPTEANAVSSRSHAVLQINITQRPRTADTITETTSASLNIIDLAGSERAAATRNNGARMKEGANINKSLLALGNCINALCQSGNQRSKHVPYRNSKLTRLLKFSLGGNCKTVMIVCVSPSSAHYDETQNTLKYANQAKNIRTKVSRNMLNVDRHVAQYVQAIHELREEVSELKVKLGERASVESGSEKKRRLDMAKEREEVKLKMSESADNVKRIIQERASAEVRLSAAGLRLAPLRQRLAEIETQIQTEQNSPSGDLESEREIHTRLAAREEAILRDEKLLSSVRILNNSVQIQRGVIMAASQNTKFNADTTEMVRTFGDFLLSEMDRLQATARYESLQSAFSLVSSTFTELIAMGTRSTLALKEAKEAIESYAQEHVVESDASLSVLAQQMQSVCNDNDEAFTRMAGTGMMSGTANTGALQRISRKTNRATPSLPPASAIHSLQHLKGGISVAGTSNKALLPITSPRKTVTRRSTAGARRNSTQVSRTATSHHARRFSSAMAPAAKKTFRWADEAGEGRIDDHDRRSASPPQVRINVPAKKPDGKSTDEKKAVTQAAKWKDRLSTIQTGREVEAGQSSGTEWEDVGRDGGRVKRDGRLFQSNFLAKKEGRSSNLGVSVEEESDSTASSTTFSDTLRAPFAELSNGVGDFSSDDNQILASAQCAPPMKARSSPYSRRSSTIGPIRRKMRSSLGECSKSTSKVTSTNTESHPPRLAIGPPTFTASRSARISLLEPQRNVSSGGTHHQSQAKTVPGTPKGSILLNNATFQGATPPAPASSSFRSSVGTAWR
ncbi:hypothetical protein CBS101457_001748 [Exobasidium rhododendri]|nr:hypothetical protein CBS101457_001748 [Exobasidium rhododendri]